MKFRHLLVLSGSLMFAGNALADDGAALLKKNNCMACHQVAAKTVGPAQKAIAAKYAGDAGAAAKLEAKVRKGGAGNWGTMAMPATPAAVSDADIKAMVATILATK
ncbi:MAG TPA: c-type cytochrome [Sideroxyarcus sp.]|nr:c-type cytochrome [Sideroxyarcus sp.]